MKAALIYLSAPLLVALLAPLAIAEKIAPYPPWLLIGTVPVVYFFTLLVAMPMYFAVPKRQRINPALMLAIAFLAGALGFFLFSCAFGGTYSRVGSDVLVQDGRFTAVGWKTLIARSLWMGALSLPGGLLFWLAARVEARSRQEAPNEA